MGRGLLARIAEERNRDFPTDQWLTDFLIPASQFAYGNTVYPFGGLNQTLTGLPSREIAPSLLGYMSVLRRCPPAFAAQMVRAQVLSQARFVFRNLPDTATPGRIFTKRALQPLEKPWLNATTGQMVSLLEWHAGVVGNAYVNKQPDQLRVLRPDWTMIIYGSQREPDDPAFALDGKVIGYAYQNRGLTGGYAGNIDVLLADEVAHWSPVPDPLSPGLGMSWLTPAIRDIQGDIAATEHKIRFFSNGATPNMVVKGMPTATQKAFDDLVDKLEKRHAGVANAYRTLYLSAGMDATVVGSDLRQLDFKATQGAGETRIALLSRVPAPILQISEGLAGSSLNQGNFSMSRRIWADTWIYPTLQDLARALAPLIKVPQDAELWPSVGDMPILREDARDAAEIENVKAVTITKLVMGGFTPDSAIAAVQAQNMSLLKQIPGWLSVQLQPGNAGGPPAPPALPNGGPPSKGLPPPKRLMAAIRDDNLLSDQQVALRELS